MKTIIAIAILIVIIIAGGAYWYFNQPTTAPSQPIESVIRRLPQSYSQNQKVLQIVPGESTAIFELNEVLSGVPTHVTGTTGDIAGDIAITTNMPASIQIGEVKVSARTLKTDRQERNNAIEKFILKSNEAANEFITFNPNKVTGVPETLQPNTEFPITITGDTTIMGTTKPLTFEGTAMFSDNLDTLTIAASTMVTYGDFGISVPNLAFLANVDKTTKLTVNIIAR